MRVVNFVTPLIILFVASICGVCVTTADSRGIPELERIYSEDQADRSPRSGPIDWAILRPRDVARRTRVLQLYHNGEIRSGKEYFYAAMILQHGESPEDFLLAHELCVTAVFAHSDEPGDWIKGAKWLAAASEDRFLGSIGRSQRFGTQYRSIDPDPAMHLAPLEEGVTDGMRAAWMVPSIKDARLKEAEMNKGRPTN